MDRNRVNHPEFGSHLRTWPTGRNTMSTNCDLNQKSQSLKSYMDMDSVLYGTPKAPQKHLQGTSAHL